MSRKSLKQKNEVRDKESQEIQKLEENPATLSSVLEEIAPGTLHKLNNSQRRKLASVSLQAVVEQHTLTQQSFSGPLPHPEILEGYGRIVEGGAERVIAMAERQSEHRQKLEVKAISSQLQESGKGQLFGFCLGILGILGSTAVGIFGHWAVGVAIAAGALGTLTASFIFGKASQRKDLQQKNNPAS